MLLRKYLDQHDLIISSSPGDGHCLVYSVLISIANQTGLITDLNALKSYIFIETVQRAQLYTTYIPSNENLLLLLSKYLLHKNYDTSFGDILPTVIANALRINLIILDQIGNVFNKIKILPTDVTSNVTVAIHRTGDHYNGLIGRMGNHRQQPRPVAAHSDQPSTINSAKKQQAPVEKQHLMQHGNTIAMSTVDPKQQQRPGAPPPLEQHMDNNTLNQLPKDNLKKQAVRMDIHRQQPRPVDVHSAQPKDTDNDTDLAGHVGDHRQQPRPVVTHLDSASHQALKANPKAPKADTPGVIKYTPDDLRALREAGNASGSLKIKRDVRKKLFYHGIWKPQNGIEKGTDDPASHIPTVVNHTNNRRHSTSNMNNIVIKPDTYICPSALNFNICCLNAQSVVNKTDSLSDYITTNDFDLIALTETWLQEDTPQSLIQDLVPNDYSIKHLPRQGARRGGGVGVIYKSNIDVSTIPTSDPYRSFEHLGLKLHMKNKDYVLHIIYRPPPSNANSLTEQMFQEDWSDFIAAESTSANPVIIMGDLNMQLDIKSRPSTIFFYDTIHAAGFTQHVSEPTHKQGHILDVVITRDGVPNITNLQVIDPAICNRHNVATCDHKAIVFQLNIPKPLPVKRTVTFRRLNRIQSDVFRDDFANGLPSALNGRSRLEIYQNLSTSLVDKHAPLTTKTIVVRNNIPYYTLELQEAKRLRRKLERRWRKTGSESDLKLYRQSASSANKLLRQAKANYYSNIIEEHGKDTKALFKVTNKLLGKSDSSPLPTGFSSAQLAEEFSKFFSDKVGKIRQAFKNCVPRNIGCNEYPAGKAKLSNIAPATVEDIKKIIAKSPSKSCVLDPLPTGLLKSCLENQHVLRFVVDMINECVTNLFPDSMKSAVILPLLKKPSLDISNFKNYRPVSNLSFLSKVVEKVVAKRLKCHLTNNNLLDVYQSAYRSRHSTETALIKVQSDIINALDNNKAVALVLLDLSAAFDTIDHHVLLQRLQNCLGVTGQALSWFESYLFNRSASVMVKGQRSSEQPLNIGVPQGSVLGPILFTCYTVPLGRIIAKHSLQRHFYADDTQLYISFDHTTDKDKAIVKLESCLEDVRTWMYQNFLKLNDEKTEFMIISKKQSPINGPITIKMGHSTIVSVDKVKNLGVIFDKNLTMDNQISNIRKQCYHQIHNIAHIRRFLSRAAIRTLVQANVTSRLDYANGLLYGLPDKSLRNLQLVQNSAARLIAKASRRTHITPILQDLHWLPVESRIRYKILTLTYKSLKDDAPKYLQDLVKRRSHGRTLRSSSKGLLDQPRYNLKTYGMRCFHVAAASEWNTLPDYVRNSDSLGSFKRALKTHLFKTAYRL